MSTNCLLTKLKGSVDANLPKINTLYLKPTFIEADEDVFYKLTIITGSSDLTVKAADNTGYFATSIADLISDPQTEITGTNLTLYFPNIAAVYEVSNKYDIKEIVWEPCKNDGTRVASTVVVEGSLNTDDLEYLPLTRLTAYKTCYGDLKNLKNTPITGEFYVGYCNFQESADVSSMPNTALRYYLQKSNINGNLSWFGNCSRATTIDITALNISGSIEDLVDAFENNQERVSKNINISLTGVPIQFGSIKLGKATTTNVGVLSWESTSKMAFASSSKAFTKGYTQQEAETAFPGLTIVMVDA